MGGITKGFPTLAVCVVNPACGAFFTANMARPKKQSVEYFPHFSKGGRTIFILETKYGNDGYAFWFKLLEVLAESDGHYYDCSNNPNWEFLLAKTRCSEEAANDIIKTLIDLGKVDAALWEKRVIWVQNLVDHFTEIYRKRSAVVPNKPSFCDGNPTTGVVSDAENPSDADISATETQERKEKGKESKEKKTYPYEDIVRLWNTICVSLPKVQKLSESRRNKIKSRLDEFGKEESVWIATVESLFEEVEASDFLCGRTSAGWKASFDWVFENSNNWVKIMEGNYTNNGATKPQQGGVRLGVGERIENGRRTYGTGQATIPMTAPPRPSENYMWNNEQQNWILL